MADIFMRAEEKVRTGIIAKIDESVIGFGADKADVRGDLIQNCSSEPPVENIRNSKFHDRTNVSWSRRNEASLACLQERRLENSLGCNMRRQFVPFRVIVCEIGGAYMRTIALRRVRGGKTNL